MRFFLLSTFLTPTLKVKIYLQESLYKYRCFNTNHMLYNSLSIKHVKTPKKKPPKAINLAFGGFILKYSDFYSITKSD